MSYVRDKPEDESYSLDSGQAKIRPDRSFK